MASVDLEYRIESAIKTRIDLLVTLAEYHVVGVKCAVVGDAVDVAVQVDHVGDLATERVDRGDELDAMHVVVALELVELDDAASTHDVVAFVDHVHKVALVLELYLAQRILGAQQRLLGTASGRAFMRRRRRVHVVHQVDIVGRGDGAREHAVGLDVLCGSNLGHVLLRKVSEDCALGLLRVALESHERVVLKGQVHLVAARRSGHACR